MLGNLGIRDGGQVTVTPAPVRAARRVTLAGPVEIVAVVTPEMLRLALLGKVVTVGDNVSLLPQDVLPAAGVRSLVEAARRSLSNTVGYAWTSTLLTVTAAEPADAGPGHHGHRRSAGGGGRGDRTAPGTVPSPASTASAAVALWTPPSRCRASKTCRACAAQAQAS